ncbi:carbohydrate ABC transporter permease [Paenibacillus nasutitermitis]|uniref:Sugar ABC transporter permease n=1 Tax=Paenibacillus nasutitermitis TaxID=1652958 RepID=A0A916YTU8_9BACL|nr:sugar ABC transporter permease [Paenibacillus nasutitermitis]GGD60142.1 sugar ABC transporter permease [Paenibacillus nasutitermitis]
MKERGRYTFIAFCILPGLILFSVFFMYPIVRSFTIAFYRWSGQTKSTEVFVGLANFKTMANDPVFWITVKNSFELLLIIPVCTIALALLFAVLLTRFRLREKLFYRTSLFFPNVLSVAVIGILWQYIYHPTMGMLNSFLTAIGLENLTHVWLGEGGIDLLAVAATMLWAGTGFYLILFIAAIESIPEQYYEAAALDGAGQVAQLFRITLPMIWEVIRVAIVLLLSGVFFGSFAFLKVMSPNGGDNYSTETMITYFYRQAFTNYNMGYATAIGLVVFLIGLAMALIANKLTRKETVEF